MGPIIKRAISLHHQKFTNCQLGTFDKQKKGMKVNSEDVTVFDNGKGGWREEGIFEYPKRIILNCRRISGYKYSGPIRHMASDVAELMDHNY